MSNIQTIPKPGDNGTLVQHWHARCPYPTTPRPSTSFRPRVRHLLYVIPGICCLACLTIYYLFHLPYDDCFVFNLLTIQPLAHHAVTAWKTKAKSGASQTNRPKTSRVCSRTAHTMHQMFSEYTKLLTRNHKNYKTHTHTHERQT